MAITGRCRFGGPNGLFLHIFYKNKLQVNLCSSSVSHALTKTQVQALRHTAMTIDVLCMGFVHPPITMWVSAGSARVSSTDVLVAIP